MKRLFIALLILFGAVSARATTDPLNSAFKPTMDTNCAHSQYDARAWMTDTMTKLRQDSGSPASNACTLTVYGTQNEFVDFQVHFHDTGSGTANLNVIVSNFVQSSPGSYTISAASTNIIVYREAYIHVQGYPTNNQLDSAVPGGTNQNTYYSGGPLGYYPDVLIPTTDPYWGQTTNAFPFTVAASQNQSAWVDILVPSGSPAGYYSGTVTVKSGSTTLATMPVTLAVWQWPNASFMPATATLKSSLGGWTYDGLCTQMYSPANSTNYTCAGYPGSQGSSDVGVTLTWLDGSLLMKDHRFGYGGGQNIYVTTGSFSTWNTYVKPLMTGGCITHTPQGNTCPVLPNSQQNMKLMDNLSTFSASVWTNWLNDFTSDGLGTAGTTPLYFYLFDEPGDSNINAHYTTIYNNAQTYHGYANPGVPLMVTNDIWFYQANQSAANSFEVTICGSIGCIQDSEDIIVPTISTLEPIGAPMQPLSAYTTWLTRPKQAGITRQWWSYLACTTAGTCSDTLPGPAGYGTAYTTWPNYNVDGKPAANRAMEWLTFKHGQTGEFYYQADVCNTPSYNASCVPPSTTWDPWNGIYYSGGWGDGSLVYAGCVVSSTVCYMGAGVTTPIILPSIRLKHIRDGVQDYEYLNALTVAGKGSIVSTQIASWITNSYTFETSGAGLQAARLNLGTTMHQLSFPPTTGTTIQGVTLSNGAKIQ